MLHGQREHEDQALVFSFFWGSLIIDAMGCEAEGADHSAPGMRMTLAIIKACSAVGRGGVCSTPAGGDDEAWSPAFRDRNYVGRDAYNVSILFCRSAGLSLHRAYVKEPRGGCVGKPTQGVDLGVSSS